MTICLLDTTILCNILPVPGRNQREAEITADMREKVVRETLVLPLTTVLGIGNHIGQLPDGRRRRRAAERLVRLVTDSIEGKTPWEPMSVEILRPEEMGSWIVHFPDYALSGIGLGDVSIIQEFEHLKRILPSERPIYIWTLDDHLSGYRRP